MPFVYDQDAQNALLQTLTRERLTAYLLHSNGNVFEALRLYEHNTRIAESLFGVVQALEVAFRNACHATISTGLASASWYNGVVLDPKEHGSVEEAKSNLRRWRKSPTPGRVVAELTFGFWVRLLAPAYEKRLWVPHLYKAFPYMKPADRAAAFTRMENIRKLRNRIAHHEPLLNRNLKCDYEMLLETLGWICPTTTWWVASINSFTRRFHR